MIIISSDKLRQQCNQLKNSQYIVLDTEFMRDKTYMSKLCLIQVAADDVTFAIDPLAEGMDLTPFFDLLADAKITKVFHSGRQDIEIFYQLTGQIPVNIFDTQIAAMVCGFGESVSYEILTNKLLGVRLDKSMRISDWSKRPLSERQLSYALDDVIYLNQIYKKLNELLAKNGRASWLSDEFAQLTAEENYRFRPEMAWLKLKLKTQAPKFVHMVRALAAWREISARAANIPRGHYIKDENLLEIAAHAPQSLEALNEIRKFGSNAIPKEQQQELVDLVIATSNEPVKHQPHNYQPSYDGALLSLLKLLLKMKSEEHEVAEKIIASKQDLLQLAYGVQAPDNPVMQGWRYEIFGRFAQDLKDGKIALKAGKNNIEIHRC